ncbi:hypothetical protein K432DRAFT_402365 [Lepidopterella palustris CBS 459.81]|uniref:Uncharacterized protein n=1 Tax=Lepidopterella palustris CBS 459.81 TaxID=1314670 RepID=A0A8E2EFR5_9PEZI|nr:hypothetical protein K432DRAFT_402365 [Lepidopterella palustris CBS 459.81]
MGSGRKRNAAPDDDGDPPASKRSKTPAKLPAKPQAIPSAKPPAKPATKPKAKPSVKPPAKPPAIATRRPAKELTKGPAKPTGKRGGHKEPIRKSAEEVIIEFREDPDCPFNEILAENDQEYLMDWVRTWIPKDEVGDLLKDEWRKKKASAYELDDDTINMINNIKRIDETGPFTYKMHKSNLNNLAKAAHQYYYFMVTNPPENFEGGGSDNDDDDDGDDAQDTEKDAAPHEDGRGRRVEPRHMPKDGRKDRDARARSRGKRTGAGKSAAIQTGGKSQSPAVDSDIIADTGPSDKTSSKMDKLLDHGAAATHSSTNSSSSELASPPGSVLESITTARQHQDPKSANPKPADPQHIRVIVALFQLGQEEKSWEPNAIKEGTYEFAKPTKGSKQRQSRVVLGTIERIYKKMQNNLKVATEKKVVYVGEQDQRKENNELEGIELADLSNAMTRHPFTLEGELTEIATSLLETGDEEYLEDIRDRFENMLRYCPHLLDPCSPSGMLLLLVVPDRDIVRIRREQGDREDVVNLGKVSQWMPESFQWFREREKLVEGVEETVIEELSRVLQRRVWNLDISETARV